MNQNEAIELAIEAWVKTSKRTPYRGWFEDRADWFQIFAKLVDAKATAKEREACAKLMQSMRPDLGEANPYADAIRARGFPTSRGEA